MVTLQAKFTVEDIIGSLHDLNNIEREKLQNALFELEVDQAVNEGLEDVKQGRVTPHNTVMQEIKTKYNIL